MQFFAQPIRAIAHAIRLRKAKALVPVIALTVGVIEFGIQFLVSRFPDLSRGESCLLNAALLSLLSAALIYFFLVRPVLGAVEAQSAKKLQILNERMQIAARAVGFGVWDWNLKTGELVWDDFLYDLYEIKRTMFSGDYDAFDRTLVAEDAERVKSELNAVFEKGESEFRSEFRVRTSAGKIKHIAAQAACFYDSDGKIDRVIGNNWDVTERVLQQVQLIESSKMASLGEMSSGVAHEINTPLTVIRGKATQLLRSVSTKQAPESLLQTSLSQIVDTCDRIAKIIRGLQRFSRSSALDPKVQCSLKGILEDSFALCAERFKNAGIRLEIADFTDLSFVARPTELSQVILNLLNNAYDAVVGTPNPWTRISVVSSAEGDRFQIWIADSGEQISAAVADRMMDPFFTTKEVGKGTGLGLSISKGIVDGHGGSLLLDRSSPQTRLIVELPLVSN